MAATPRHDPSRNNVLGLPAGSIVDGIRASFNRWMRASEPSDFREGEPGPFLFNFIDYLTLALPTGCEVGISSKDGRHRISTSPNAPADCVPPHSTLLLDTGGPMLDLLCDEPDVREAVKSILSGLDQAFQRFVGLALRLGLKQILPWSATIIGRSSCPLWPEVQNKHTESVLEGILEHTQFNLTQAIMLGDEAYIFAIRRYACEGILSGFGYERQPNGRAMRQDRDIPPLWATEVQLALKTGLLRLKALDESTILLSVPCHFGGIPWLVLCCKLPNDKLGRWRAYTIYRDVIPRLNDVLRLLGQESYAKEMLRLFQMTDADVDGDLEAMIERVNAIWKHLVCIYPLPKAFLRPVTSGTQSAGAFLLPLRAGLAEVALADEPMPCVSVTARLISESGGAYAKISPAKIRDNFVTPVLAVVQEARSREARLLAEARKVALSHYGHTLKHRLDVLSAFLDAEAPSAVRLRADMLKDLTLILQLNAVDDREELCERLPEQKRKRFMDLEGIEDAPSELDLLPRIQEWSEVLTREEDVPVRDASGRIEMQVRCPVRLKVFPRITSASVGWQMTSAGQNARLKEPVFRELLFELLNNIWKYGDRILLTGDDGKPYVQINVWVDKTTVHIGEERLPILVLANIIQPAKVDDCPLIASKWTRWPDKGDIRYNGPGMALDLFRRLGLGDMYHRTPMHAGELYLEVGVSFAELHLPANLAKEQDDG